MSWNIPTFLNPPSQIRDLGPVALPAYTGLRVMMMPFLIEDMQSIPFVRYREPVRLLLEQNPDHLPEGTAYLTIDEAEVSAGETHRRPGLHVDGLGSWGGPAPYACGGMILLSSRLGCVAYDQPLPGMPDAEGDCEKFRSLLDVARRVEMMPGRAYWCAPFLMHESIPMPEQTRRQVVRISMPNGLPWHECYTPNPYGIKPSGPIVKGRENFMAYRNGANG